jgi:transmembrane 9 superfamily protein 3
MWGRGVSLWVMLVGFCAVGRVTGNEHNHQYAIGDMTTLWVNKVGPYNNPQETYNYYTLPFCKTHPEDKVKRKWSGLGEVLEGNELIDSQIDIRFRIDVDSKAVCTTSLGKKEVQPSHSQAAWGNETECYRTWALLCVAYVPPP